MDRLRLLEGDFGIFLGWDLDWGIFGGRGKSSFSPQKIEDFQKFHKKYSIQIFCFIFYFHNPCYIFTADEKLAWNYDNVLTYYVLYCHNIENFLTNQNKNLKISSSRVIMSSSFLIFLLLLLCQKYSSWKNLKIFHSRVIMCKVFQSGKWLNCVPNFSLRDRRKRCSWHRNSLRLFSRFKD